MLINGIYTNVNITYLEPRVGEITVIHAFPQSHHRRRPVYACTCICIVLVCIYTCFLPVLLKHDLCYEILTWNYKIWDILWDIRYENYILRFFGNLYSITKLWSLYHIAYINLCVHGVYCSLCSCVIWNITHCTYVKQVFKCIARITRERRVSPHSAHNILLSTPST